LPEKKERKNPQGAFMQERKAVHGKGKMGTKRARRSKRELLNPLKKAVWGEGLRARKRP